MSIDEKTVERMVAWFRTYVAADVHALVNGRSVYAEALEIANLLPDPDLEAAKCIAMSILYDGMGSADHFQAVFTKAALLGIRHGRANP